MALWVCAGTGGCGTKYAVGLFRCPRCHNTEFFEDGDSMAKITRHGGATDATLPAPGPDQDDMPQPMDTEPLDVTEDMAGSAEPVAEGGEESSPGNSSSASTETQTPSPEPSSKPTPKPARTTGSRSAKARTQDSSARSTDGGQTEPSSAADGGTED